MIDGVAFTLTVTAVVLAVVASARAARGRALDGALLAGVGVLQLALVAQAVLDVAAWARGHRMAEPGVHGAYLVTSVAVLPVAVVYAGRGRDRWATVVVALALVVSAVLQVRLMTTWRAAA